jgi:chemotaxis protein MotB
MLSARFMLAVTSLALAALAAGCQFAPKSELLAAETKARSLAEQSKAQLAEIANLKAHSRTLENHLIQAEKDLAALDGRPAHLGRTPPDAESGRRLADLCRRYPDLVYDANTGVCQLDADLLFDSAESKLTTESQRRLDEFARRMRSAELRDYRVMVVGHADGRQIAHRETKDRFPDNWHLSTARALQVVQYLQKAGLHEDRVGVVGYGRNQPIVSNASNQRSLNRRVEVFIMPPETPVVGWYEPVKAPQR